MKVDMDSLHGLSARKKTVAVTVTGMTGGCLTFILPDHECIVQRVPGFCWECLEADQDAVRVDHGFLIGISLAEPPAFIHADVHARHGEPGAPRVSFFQPIQEREAWHNKDFPLRDSSMGVQDGSFHLSRRGRRRPRGV